MAKDEKYKIKIEEAWKKFDEKDLSAAKELCKQIIKEFDDKLGANYLLGLIYLDEKQFLKSEKQLKEALKKDDEKKAGGFINYWLGKVYDSQTFSENENPVYNKDFSRKHFEQALDYNEFPADVINRLHYIYQNDFKIIQLFKKAIKKFPENINFVLTLSDTYLKTGQIENQEKVLLTAKENFNSTHLLYELSKIELNKRNFDKSRELLNLAIEFNENPKSEFALQLQLANIFYAEGELEKAKDFYEASFNTEKNTDNFWFGLIGVLMCLDNSNFNIFSSLIATMEVTKQFVIDDWFGDMPINFDSQRHIGIDLPMDEKEAIKKINSFKKSQSEDDILGKIELMKCSLYKNIGNKSQRLKAIRESIKHLNTYHYDFILNELCEAYTDVFYELIENEKSIDNIINELIATLKDEYSFRKLFVEHLESIIDELHKQKKYDLVIKLYDIFSKQQVDKADIWFEVGYAFNEQGNFEKAKYSYHRYIELKGETSAVLNNLGNIYKREDKIDTAIEMYQKAVELEKDDDLVRNNLANALEKQKELTKEAEKRNAINKLFLNAVDLLKSENFFTLESLHNFLLNCQKEEEFDNWSLPIQAEMFPILMNTNARKSFDLKENWISKNYIIQTEINDDFDIPYYKINPYINTEVTRLRTIVADLNLPSEWVSGLNNISIYQLNELNFSETLLKISKVNKRFRPLISRDYNELVFNYLVGNKKSTIVLSGSFVELILTYYCDRKKIKKIEYKNAKGNIIKKELYDCVLYDLISFIDEKKYFGNDFFPLTNLSRVYRNFVHPGVEMKNTLDKTKSDLCFISSIEILRKIIN